MKTKITILSIFLAFIMSACSGFEEKANLTLYLGGSSNSSYSASALTNWPPQDADLDSLRFEIKLTSLSGERPDVSPERSGSNPITFTCTVPVGTWIIVVEAYVKGDNPDVALYARGTTSVTLKPGRNNVPITMKREGIYKLGIDILPDKIEILPGGSDTFTATPSHGLEHKKDFIESLPNPYVWSVSGSNLHSGTVINPSSGHLTVSQSEEFPKTLTVMATYVNDESIYGTATVTIKDVINAQTPVILTGPTYTIVGNTIDLTVAASVSDGGILSYDWYSSDTPLSNPLIGGTQAGTGDTITQSNFIGTKYYYVVITNTNTNVNGNTTATNTGTVAVTGNFVEVTGITVSGITAAPTVDVIAGEPFTLTGTVEPNNATNKTIVWTVKDAGTTGATISGNTLNTTAVGIVTVTATIINGKINGNYEDYFNIEVKSPAAEVTIGSTLYVFMEFQDAFDFIQNNATVTSATIKVLKNITLPGGNYSLTGTKEITLTCADDYTISLSSNGALFEIGSGAKLIVTGNASKTLTLQGQGTSTTNNSSLVSVSGGTFEMENGVIIEGNIANNTSGAGGAGGGGGVFVGAGSIFNMKGGTIKGNGTAVNNNVGGGVSVRDGGTFNMTDGTIENNGTLGNSHTSVSGGGVHVGYGSTFTMIDGTIKGNGRPTNNGDGGGVNVSQSAFTMNGGTIKENTGGGGGGVYLTGGGGNNFTMSNNATIESNTAISSGSGRGGGVYVENGIFTMNDYAAIKGNTAGGGNSGGGGVAVISGTFNMNDDATIEGNEISNSIFGGGGVYVGTNSSTFNMNGGTIKDNKAYGLNDITYIEKGGGGVYVGNGTFTMSGGTIYGSGAAVGDANFSEEAGRASLYMNSTGGIGTAVYGDGTTIPTTGNGSSDTLMGIPAP